MRSLSSRARGLALVGALLLASGVAVAAKQEGPSAQLPVTIRAKIADLERAKQLACGETYLQLVRVSEEGQIGLEVD